MKNWSEGIILVGHMGNNVIASDLSLVDNARVPGGRSSGARDVRSSNKEKFTD